MPSTPLTDAIVALTTYANTVTGESDTTLSAAVDTLINGYGASDVPTGYKKVLMLESSGTQYIDTQIYTKANQTYFLTFEKYGGQDNVFGNNVSDCASFVQISSNGLSLYYKFGSTSYGTLSVQNIVEPMAIKLNINEFAIWDSATGDYVTKATISGSAVTENSSIHNILFGRSTGANSRELSSERIYRFKVEENGALISDMIPVAREADGVLGMYDLVRNQFFTNSGTGTFKATIA